jgi:hypothetical protein
MHPARPQDADSDCGLTARLAPAARTLRSRPGSALIERLHDPNPTAHPVPSRSLSNEASQPQVTPDGIVAHEPWVTKQQLADHLLVTRRWVESQQQLGLPYLRLGRINRYSITEVEAWLRERYATPATREAD